MRLREPGQFLMQNPLGVGIGHGDLGGRDGVQVDARRGWQDTPTGHAGRNPASHTEEPAGRGASTVDGGSLPGKSEEDSLRGVFGGMLVAEHPTANP
jgi:hypothetical protein